MVHSYTGTHGVKKKKTGKKNTVFVSTQTALVLGHTKWKPLRFCLDLASVSRSLCSFVDEAREFLPGFSPRFLSAIYLFVLDP